jgi:hypothetical protein
MNLADLFRPNVVKLVAKRDIRRLTKAMDHEDSLVSLAAERGLREIVIDYHEQVPSKDLVAAITKLVIHSVRGERFGDIDVLAQLDKSGVIDELIAGVQSRSQRIGQLINQPPDALFLAMRSGVPGLYKEELIIQSSDAELIMMRTQLYGMMRKLEELAGNDVVALVQSKSKGVEGEWWINNELKNYTINRSKRTGM